MFCFLCGILTAFAQLFHLGWTAVDSVFDLATSLVADDRIVALFCSEVTAVAIYFIFISGQQLGCFCGIMDISFLVKLNRALKSFFLSSIRSLQYMDSLRISGPVWIA